MRSILLSTSLFFSTILAYATVSGTWINHSAIDIDSQISRSTAVHGTYNYITKMYESDDYIYVLAHGRGYNSQIAGMTSITLLPSYVDKRTSNFESLSNKYNLSGTKVIDMAFSPVSNTLALLYENKMVDFINESTGEVISATGPSSYIAPGGAQYGRIQFDREGKVLTVASNFGFMALSAESGEILTLCKLDEEVKMVVKMGDKYLGYKSSGFFKTPTDLTVTSSKCTPVSITGFTGMVDGFEPMSDSSFILIGTPTNYTSVTAYGVTLPEDANSATAYKLISETFNISLMSLSNALYSLHPLEGIFWPTRNGMGISGATNFIEISYRDSEPVFNANADATAFAKTNIVSKKKDTSDPKAGDFGKECYQRATSLDFNNFWILRPRHGLIKRTAVPGTNGAVSWEDASEVIQPNMSAALNAYHLTWHPDFGVLGRIPGARYNDAEFPSVKYLSDGLCAFKNGKWTRLSIFHTDFNIAGNLPLIWSPRGIAYDPLEPQYIYEVSPQHGIHKMDMTDPSYHLLLSSDGDSNKANPAFVCITPSMLYPKAGFSIPTFDANGTMWTNLYTREAVRGDEYHPTELWYWTAEDRMAVKTPEDYAAHPMKQIKFDDVESLFRGENIPLTLNGCENYILHLPSFYNDTYMYDHRGTLDDQSDDRICLFDKVIYENGDAFPSIYVGRTAVQDPYDGKVLMATGRGYVVFDPHQAFEAHQVMEWLQPEESDDPSYSPHPIGINNSWGITIDNLGRKWISTIGEGLYCISADRTRVLAQFTEKNSPLSDDVYGVVYNPERNSIMVGTDHGIMEFIPSGSDLESLSPSAPAPSVFPRSLHPDYQGHILFSGLKDGKYNIISAGGEVIDTIEAISGRADWHPATLRQSLPSGTYTLEGIDNTEIIIL